MSASGVYTLSLDCDEPGCVKSTIFKTDTRLVALEQARLAGWKITRKLAAYCDEHEIKYRGERGLKIFGQ